MEGGREVWRGGGGRKSPISQSPAPTRHSLMTRGKALKSGGAALKSRSLKVGVDPGRNHMGTLLSQGAQESSGDKKKMLIED